MLEPRSIAIAGISGKPGSPGRILLSQLAMNGYTGEVHLVGRSGGEIDGHPVLGSVDDLPQGVDLALLVTPAAGLRDAVAGCVRREVNAAVAYASGLAEFGGDGRAQQADIGRLAAAGSLALTGPNCLGFVNYVTPLTTIFIPGRPLPRLKPGTTGALAVIAQSGGLMGMISRGLLERGLPVSYTVSTGNEAGLTLADYLDFFAADPSTGGIVIYAEDIRDPRGFLQAVRAARRHGKFVTLMHSGRSERGQRAAASHTGALAADYPTLATVLTRAGACLTDTLEELVDVSEILACYPRPPVGDTAVVTTSGAFCAIALDALDGLGVGVPDPSPATIASLTERFPAYMRPGNPLDLGTAAAADPRLFHDGLAALLADDAIGSAVLAVPFVDEASNRVMFEQVTKAAAGQPKPVAVALFGDITPVSPDLRAYAAEHAMVISNAPERAVRAIAAVTRYGRTLARGVAQPGRHEPIPRQPRGSLPEWRGKQVLASIGLPVPEGGLAVTVEQAAETAKAIGYPVVAKAQAAGLQHKTEAGAVILGIEDEDALRTAWMTLAQRTARAGVRELDGVLVEAMAGPGTELMVGARRHPDWGPVVMAGLGGIWVEALRDVRLLPPDLPEREIVAELRQLRTARLLDGFRGQPPADLGAVARAVAAVGRLMTDCPQVTEIDINPLLARPDGVLALDALIVCGDGKQEETTA